MRDKELTGKDASSVLHNQAFIYAVDEIKADLVSKFEATKYRDSSERDEIWRQLNALKSVVNKLQQLVSYGNMEREIKSRNSIFEKLKGL